MPHQLRHSAPGHAGITRHELQWSAAALAIGVAVVVALRPERGDIDPGTIALIMLFAPLIASLASLRVAIICAVLSAIAFNFVFTEPYDSLEVRDPTSVIALVVYVTIALAVGFVVARMRRHATTSDERASQALLLRDLTIDLVRQNVWLQPPMSTALNDIVASLHLHGASLSLEIPGGEQFTISAGRTPATQAATTSRASTLDASDEVHVTTLRSGDKLRAVPIATSTEAFGMLSIEPNIDAPLGEGGEQLISLFANVVALACERAAYMQQSIQRKALEETDRLRTTLMQSVSHDLRTPLASISALASAMPELGKLPVEQQRLLDDIIEQTQRLSRLVDQVLDVSRIESGNLKLRRETLPLDDLIHSAVSAVRLTSSATISMAIEECPAIPIDEVLLKQALVNLLENATRYGEPPFEVTLRHRNAAIELRVIDHGAGIPEAERRRIFDPTFAMRRATTDERSRGLGLAISAGFVEAHHGHIRAEPTPGGGATFVITLPDHDDQPAGHTS